MSATTLPEISFRPATEDDLPFLYQVYASTREHEMAIVPWDDTEKENFLQMQFHLQHQYYHENYDNTSFDVIELDGQPAGRLYLQRRDDEFRIVDIALLPEHRRQGVGRKIMQDILDEASAAKLPTRIHVEHHNPALHLYQRLGFKKIGDTEVYFLLERLPK